MSIYDKLSTLGYTISHAPRTNPDNLLSAPFVMRGQHGRVVLRGATRDDLETKMHKFLARIEQDYGR